MPMLAIMEFAEKIKNNFIKAIELLRLKFTPTPKNRLWGFAKNLSLHLKKYALIFSAVLILVGIGLVVPHGPANANWVTDMIGSGFMRLLYIVVYYIFFVLFYIAYYIAYFAAGMLNINLNPEIMRQVLTSPAIANGWMIFRDIANLFFILILLFIAIGTIVRSQSYNLKNLLPKLIIAVFLINFSNVIAGVIIDFGNIFMYGVLKWMSCGVGNNTCASDFFSGLMDVIDKFDAKYGILDGFSASAEATVGIAVATIYTFLYGLILLALGTFLTIRIAAFAILIILSPLLAFTGEVFPGLQELSSKWWKNLVNYTLFGPIFALLLYISGLMAQQVINVPIPSFFSSGNPALGTFGTLYVTIIQNIIPLIFLLAIIPITQELGIAGANAVLGSTVLAGGAFLAGAASFAGGAIDRYMARGVQSGYSKKRRVLSYFSPGAWKRAIKTHTAESEHDYDRAAGKMREKFVQPATDWGRKSAVKHEEDARQREVARQRADIKGKDKGELVYLMTEALDKGMMERAEAIALELATTSDMNEVYTRMKDKSGKFYENSPDGFVNFMKDKFEDRLGEDKTGRLMAELANLEKKDGHHAFKGSSSFDMDSGKYVIEKNHATREAKAAEEFGKIEPQAKWRGLDKRTLLDERINPATGLKEWAVADRGASIIENMTKADLENVRKGKPEHLKIIRKALEPGGIASLTPAQRTAIGVGVAGSKFEEFKKKLDEAINVGTAGPAAGGGPGAGGPGGGGGGYAGGGAYTAGGGYTYTATPGGGTATPFEASDIKMEGGAQKGKIYVDESDKLVIDSVAMRNLNELDEKDKDLKNEGFQEILKHEAEHLKGKSKEAGKYSAKEMMAELQKLGKGDYKNVDDYIQKQAKAHIVNDVAAHGLGAMKNIKYGLGDKDVKPSGLHFDFIRPNVQKAVIAEMEKRRQGLVGKYDESEEMRGLMAELTAKKKIKPGKAYGLDDLRRMQKEEAESEEMRGLMAELTAKKKIKPGKAYDLNELRKIKNEEGENKG